MPFVGGRLKLKGVGEVGGVSKKKKKKKKTNKEEKPREGDEEQRTAAAAAVEEEKTEGGEEREDRRTEAERRHDDAVAAREAERVARLAAQSHRDRVAAFNAHLATLSEHHDIPKVGPG